MLTLSGCMQLLFSRCVVLLSLLAFHRNSAEAFGATVILNIFGARAARCAYRGRSKCARAGPDEAAPVAAPLLAVTGLPPGRQDTSALDAFDAGGLEADSLLR